MIKTMSLISVLVFAPHAFAASSGCDALANQALTYANISGNSSDNIMNVEDGRLKVSQDSKRIRSKSEAKGGKKSTVTFDRVVITPTGSMTITETIDYDATKENSAIKYMSDRKFAETIFPTPIYGMKRTLHDDGKGGCTIVQESVFKQDNMKNFAELVKADQAFCDSVRGILKDMGKASFEQCQNGFKQASALYNKRAKELEASDQKFISLGDNSLASTMEALQSCSPDEWSRRAVTPMGALPSIKVPNRLLQNSGPFTRENKVNFKAEAPRAQQ